jgi:outer membrane lipoprotein SlyB
MTRSPCLIGCALLLAMAVASGCNDNASTGAKATDSPKARFTTLTIPAGTIIIASLGTRLDTGDNHTGDSFYATTHEPLVVDGTTVVPSGARIRGTLGDVQASGRISGRARMTLGFDEIIDAQGETHAISARPITMQAASATHGDVEKIAAGGVLGAVVGGLTGGGKGAAIGAGAGAGAGTVLMLATKGDEIELAVGHRLSIHLTSPASIQVLAQQ